MEKHIYDESGTTLIRKENATPVCQVHFCDRCGDCLACDGDGLCYPDECAHFWVQYGDHPTDSGGG